MLPSTAQALSMTYHPLCQRRALPWGQTARNGATAAKPWLGVPSLGTVAQPASCPRGSFPMPASLPKEGHGRTKAMLLFHNTFLVIQPREEEGWARKRYDLILSRISPTRRKQGLTALCCHWPCTLSFCLLPPLSSSPFGPSPGLRQHLSVCSSCPEEE